MKEYLYLFSTLICLCFFSCAGTGTKNNSTGEATIPVAHERLYLAPLISEAGLEKLPGWPADPVQQKVLLKILNKIWGKLKAEFRRCEKKGFYEMVEDFEAPSMRISVVITSAELVEDTLHIPIRLQAERIPDGQHFIYTIPAYAYTPKQTNDFHRIGLLLSNYKQSFPYKLLVSFFYAH